jgi:hypothetical protein
MPRKMKMEMKLEAEEILMRRFALQSGFLGSVSGDEADTRAELGKQKVASRIL